ncbi:tyrosine-type recombinase/integrase [Friedmanniella luteola]|uniref:tyrosine-type recombinase/integrase n=1 Tax=Friedmanniella luteola TaxID=546871 RepID=UPI0018D2DD72
MQFAWRGRTPAWWPREAFNRSGAERDRGLGREERLTTRSTGGPVDAADVRRALLRVVAKTGLDAPAWTPRELRHSFVSLLPSPGMSIEDISHLAGHASRPVTEVVHDRELRPVPTRGGSMPAPRATRREVGQQ